MPNDTDALFHTVLISIRKGAPQDEVGEIIKIFQTLADRCGGKHAGILFWRVTHNIDLRKGVNLVEVAFFRDHDAFQAFKSHPAHKELNDRLQVVADWLIGDIFIDLRDLPRAPVAQPQGFTEEELNRN